MIILPKGKKREIEEMKIKDSKIFGDVVRQARKKQGLTQTQLAGIANTSPRLIGELERGKPTIQLEKALKIAWMLGINIETPEITND